MHNIGDKQCDFCVKNVCKLTTYTDTQGDHEICRKCFNKVTGRDSRVEIRMSDYLDKHFGTEYLIGSDQRIYGDACQKYRPDKLYASPNLVLHIECDEHQHSGHYNYSYKKKRISDIYDEFPGKQYVIIRWNPHKYNDPELRKRPNIEERLKLLLQLMNRSVEIPYPHQIYIFYMFYDTDNDAIAQNIQFRHIYTEEDIENIEFE